MMLTEKCLQMGIVLEGNINYKEEKKMLNLIKRLVKDEEGQAMVEYGLIVALISIAAINIIWLIGPKLIKVFQKVETSLPAAP